MRRRGQSSYKFSDRTHPVMAVISVLIASAASIALAVMCILSGLHGGTGSIVYGIAGIIMMFSTIGGLVLAVLSFRKESVHYTFPVVGAVMNGLLSVLYILIYIFGAVSM